MKQNPTPLNPKKMSEKLKRVARVELVQLLLDQQALIAQWDRSPETAAWPSLRKEAARLARRLEELKERLRA